MNTLCAYCSPRTVTQSRRRDAKSHSRFSDLAYCWSQCLFSSEHSKIVCRDSICGSANSGNSPPGCEFSLKHISTYRISRRALNSCVIPFSSGLLKKNHDRSLVADTLTLQGKLNSPDDQIYDERTGCFLDGVSKDLRQDRLAAEVEARVSRVPTRLEITRMRKRNHSMSSQQIPT
jgi:hypothetical protein